MRKYESTQHQEEVDGEIRRNQAGEVPDRDDEGSATAQQIQ